MNHESGNHTHMVPKLKRCVLLYCYMMESTRQECITYCVEASRSCIIYSIVYGEWSSKGQQAPLVLVSWSMSQDES